MKLIICLFYLTNNTKIKFSNIYICTGRIRIRQCWKSTITFTAPYPLTFILILPLKNWLDIVHTCVLAINIQFVRLLIKQQRTL